MNASKENARKAQEKLDEATATQSRNLSTDAAEFLRDFLTAAEKKLPSEASYKKEKGRRAKRAPVKTAAKRKGATA